jgi:hypothetical protein
MVSSLHLNEGEIDALRGLQAGTNRLALSDPVWEELKALQLGELRGTRILAWRLTIAGRMYRTDEAAASLRSQFPRPPVEVASGTPGISLSRGIVVEATTPCPGEDSNLRHTV